MIATPLTTAPVTSPTELPHMAEVLEIGNDPQIFDIDGIKQKLVIVDIGHNKYICSMPNNYNVQ